MTTSLMDSQKYSWISFFQNKALLTTLDQHLQDIFNLKTPDSNMKNQAISFCFGLSVQYLIEQRQHGPSGGQGYLSWLKWLLNMDAVPLSDMRPENPIADVANLLRHRYRYQHLSKVLLDLMSLQTNQVPEYTKYIQRHGLMTETPPAELNETLTLPSSVKQSYVDFMASLRNPADNQYFLFLTQKHTMAISYQRTENGRFWSFFDPDNGTCLYDNYEAFKEYMDEYFFNSRHSDNAFYDAQTKEGTSIKYMHFSQADTEHYDGIWKDFNQKEEVYIIDELKKENRELLFYQNITARIMDYRLNTEGHIISVRVQLTHHLSSDEIKVTDVDAPFRSLQELYAAFLDAFNPSGYLKRAPDLSGRLKQAIRMISQIVSGEVNFKFIFKDISLNRLLTAFFCDENHHQFLNTQALFEIIFDPWHRKKWLKKAYAVLQMAEINQEFFRDTTDCQALQKAHFSSEFQAKNTASLLRLKEVKSSYLTKIEVYPAPHVMYIVDARGSSVEYANVLGLLWLKALKESREAADRFLKGLANHAVLSEKKFDNTLTGKETRNLNELHALFNSLKTELLSKKESLFIPLSPPSSNLPQKPGSYFLYSDKHCLILDITEENGHYQMTVYDPHIGELNVKGCHLITDLMDIQGILYEYLNEKVDERETRRAFYGFSSNAFFIKKVSLETLHHWNMASDLQQKISLIQLQKIPDIAEINYEDIRLTGTVFQKMGTFFDDKIDAVPFYLDTASMKALYFNADTLNRYLLNLNEAHADALPSIQFLEEKIALTRQDEVFLVGDDTEKKVASDLLDIIHSFPDRSVLPPFKNQLLSQPSLKTDNKLNRINYLMQFYSDINEFSDLMRSANTPQQNTIYSLGTDLPAQEQWHSAIRQTKEIQQHIDLANSEIWENKYWTFFDLEGIPYLRVLHDEDAVRPRMREEYDERLLEKATHFLNLLSTKDIGTYYYSSGDFTLTKLPVKLTGRGRQYHHFEISSLLAVDDICDTNNSDEDSSSVKKEVSTSAFSPSFMSSALFNFGDGDDTAMGYRDKKNIFKGGNGIKKYAGGNLSDAFYLSGSVVPRAPSDFYGLNGEDIIIADYDLKGTDYSGYSINLATKKAHYRSFDGRLVLVATLEDIEHAGGHKKTEDYLTGNHQNNVLNGMGGKDNIWGEGGNDTLILEQGEANGGLGVDTYIILENTQECSVEINIYDQKGELSLFIFKHSLQHIQSIRLYKNQTMPDTYDIQMVLLGETNVQTTLVIHDVYHVKETDRKTLDRNGQYFFSISDGLLLSSDWPETITIDETDQFSFTPQFSARYSVMHDTKNQAYFQNTQEENRSVSFEKREDADLVMVGQNRPVVLLADMQLKLMDTRFNDRIIGNAESNVISSSRGNDYLEGNEGEDIYRIEPSEDISRVVCINNQDTGTYPGPDLLILPVRSDKIIHIQAVGQDMILTLKRETEKSIDIRLKNFLLAQSYRHILLVDIEKNIFELNVDEQGQAYLGHPSGSLHITENSDTLIISNGDKLTQDQLDAGGGNDVILDTSHCDYSLHGGEGNDIIISPGNSSKKLYGDRGNDQLWGGKGNDIYFVSRLDGHTTIEDSGGRDTLSLPDIKLDELFFTEIDEDVYITVKDSDFKDTFSIKLTASGCRAPEEKKIESITTSGDQYLLEDLLKLNTAIPFFSVEEKQHLMKKNHEPVFAEAMVQLAGGY